MKKSIFSILCILSITLLMAQSEVSKHVEICIDSKQEEGRINKHIYGFLLEHLYHSVSNGIWGENVWNRSFEELLADGNWTTDTQGHLIINALGVTTGSRFNIGHIKDGVISMDVRRNSGQGSILIGFRDQQREHLKTNSIVLNLGKHDENTHVLECRTGWIWHTPVAQLSTLTVKSNGINLEEWNHVVIEVKGSKITIRLNSQTIFEQDIANSPNEGYVTIGAIDCQAELKHIFLRDAENKEVPINLNLCRHWCMVGDCLSSTESINPLNHDHALIVTNKGKWAGIEQKEKYYVRKEDKQCGSVFLKGNVDNVIAQFIKDGQILGEQTITLTTSTWHEYPLDLPVQSNHRDVTLRLLTRHKGWFCVDQISLMHQSSLRNQGFRSELKNAVANIRPTMLRWPGGSFVELYRFEHGMGPQSSRRGIYRWDDYDPLSFGIDEYIAFCKMIDATPQIVVPIGYHNYAAYAPDLWGQEDWLQRALDWLEYCNGDTTTTWGRQRALNGHPEPYGVKYWEIDNEVWKMNPHLYAQLTRIFSIAMKKKDSSIRIIGCGSGRLGAEGIGLDSIMIHDVGKYIDYISPHHYQDLNRYGNDGVEEYGRYLDQLASWIDQSENPNMKIYLSEWNLSGTDMRTGLFAGGFLNRLERTPRLEMAAPALFLRHLSAPGWDNAFINFDQDRWFPAPNYVVMKLWRDNYLPIRVAYQGNPKDLNISATKSENGDRLCLKIVNPTENDIHLVVTGFSNYTKILYTVVKSDALTDKNTLENPNTICPKSDTVNTIDGKAILVVPHYSASVLTGQI